MAQAPRVAVPIPLGSDDHQNWIGDQLHLRVSTKLSMDLDGHMLGRPHGEVICLLLKLILAPFNPNANKLKTTPKLVFCLEIQQTSVCACMCVICVRVHAYVGHCYTSASIRECALCHHDINVNSSHLSAHHVLCVATLIT